MQSEECSVIKCIPVMQISAKLDWMHPPCLQCITLGSCWYKCGYFLYFWTFWEPSRPQLWIFWLRVSEKSIWRKFGENSCSILGKSWSFWAGTLLLYLQQRWGWVVVVVHNKQSSDLQKKWISTKGDCVLHWMDTLPPSLSSPFRGQNSNFRPLQWHKPRHPHTCLLILALTCEFISYSKISPDVGYKSNI